MIVVMILAEARKGKKIEERKMMVVGSDPERRKRRDEGCEALMIQKRREWVDADSLRKMMRVVMPLHEEEEEIE